MEMTPEVRHRIQVALNLFPGPVVVYEMSGTGKPLYVNTAAIRYLKPSAVDENEQFDPDSHEVLEKILAELPEKDVTAWRAGWADPTGRILEHDEIPGVRVSKGECFSQLELIWKNFHTGRTYNALLYGCNIPETAVQPSLGLLVFVDTTTGVQHREQLKTALLMRDEFITFASHELRTPITSMTLTVRMMLNAYQHGRELPREEVIKKLEILNRGVGRLTDLINQMLEVSLITSPRNMKLENVDFCATVRDVIERFEPIASSKSVVITQNIPIEPIRGGWDRLRVDQIVANLLDNALKYGQGRSINVNVILRAQHVELTVRDHGMGVKPEDQQRIFQRYERAVSVYQHSGMGVGLWLASEYARSMSGSLWVENPTDGGLGSLFIFHLPLTQ